VMNSFQEGIQQFFPFSGLSGQHGRRYRGGIAPSPFSEGQMVFHENDTCSVLAFSCPEDQVYMLGLKDGRSPSMT